MHVYVLSASANSGKTTTLNALAQFLYALKPQYTLGLGCPIPPIPPNASDNQYLFDTMRNGGNVRVGIYTAGDTAEVIKDAFNYFKSNNCDVCFVASRTYGLTIDEIERQSRLLKVIPRYLYLICSTVARAKLDLQMDTVRFMESLI